MGQIFYIMGKSSTGKDTIFKEVIKNQDLHLKNMVLYTTRPIRAKEENGKQYFFVDDAAADRLQAEGRIIEMRAYDTVYGVWKYFTVADENTDLDQYDYLALGTLDSYMKLKEYYGSDKIVPIYIEVDDGIRLERALKRERKPQNQKYAEMCRRFLADTADFSEENLAKAGITRRFSNDNEREECMKEVQEFIQDCQKARESRHDGV